MSDVGPAFELHRPDGSAIKIWANGRVDGVPAGTTIINRIGRIVTAAQKEAVEEYKDEQNSICNNDE